MVEVVKYEHKSGPRKVRMKVGGWPHVALEACGEAYPDSMNRNNMLPGFAMYATAKHIEKLLRYGLLEHELKGPYRINEDGIRVLKQLNDVMPIVPLDGEFNNWITWRLVTGRPEGYRYGIIKGYSMVTVRIPGSKHWEEYFESRTW